MLLKKHPLAKTDIELRRTIHRLQHYKESGFYDDPGIDVDDMIRKLRDVRLSIPEKYRNADLRDDS